MMDREKEDIKIILDYMWSDEERHYRASPRKDHIFAILKRLAKAINYES